MSIDDDWKKAQEEDAGIQNIRELIRKKGSIEIIEDEGEYEMINIFKIDDNQWFVEKNGKFFNRVFNHNKNKYVWRKIVP